MVWKFENAHGAIVEGMDAAWAGIVAIVGGVAKLAVAIFLVVLAFAFPFVGIPALVLAVLYLIIKAAVKNGVKAAKD